ncbi:glycosyl transferase family 2 [Kyrpidia tusciae DSM 2912]|uniref:Glycosyl transferase family 2 n=1 Tax=Kyrpidia tusciae (strain DSM 2912 / NBRC 15312 / T2) TaxID=562970 RepID=D5WVY7_KYRT2|nr:glycosyltransferase family 2 protein [Kyrpidia tusciae]ADG05619.1 glycosyl transferase family 2 [Kyrpidia tusciae DSM 2912]
MKYDQQIDMSRDTSTSLVMRLWAMTFIRPHRIRLLIRALGQYWRSNGGWKHVGLIIKKAKLTYELYGLKGIWKKALSMVTLDQLTDPNLVYETFIRKHESFDKGAISKRIEQLVYCPVISVLVPVYNTEERWLRKCIESVQNQFYPHWELCIADDCSPNPRVREILEEYARKDHRIKLIFRETNGHISEASNSALSLATGDFVALLDHDDELAPHALLENVLLLNQHPDADMIYSDEDKIDENGKRYDPFFKPDWSPDTFLSQMYTCHLGVYRTELVRKIGGFRKGFEGAQDYDLVLRLTEETERIYHIPKVLYHWRATSQSTASSAAVKPYAQTAGLRALKEALLRRKEDGWVEQVDGVYRVHYVISKEPLVSIIVPTRDMAELLDRCLVSLFERTSYKNFEVIIVDNGSCKQETCDVFKKWVRQEPVRVRVERIDIPFNYSRLNNMAVRHAKGELLLFLNNDIEILSPDSWLAEMVGQAERKTVGAVGAMLLYPDYTIQHAGVVLTGGVAGHSHKHFPVDAPGYFGRLRTISNYSAVTGACLMVKKELFDLVGGFDERLEIAFNDVDFCLKLLQRGFYNVWLPHVRMVHYESKSRGYEDTPEKQERFLREIQLMRERWGHHIGSDPFYNPNLSQDKGDFLLRSY